MQEQQPFLRGYEQLKIPIVDDDGVPAWPELFPIEKIDQMRDTVGDRHFSSQMMLEYLSTERARLDPGALRFYEGEFNSHKASLECRVESRDTPGDNLNSQLSTLNSVTGLAVYWDPSGGRVKSDASVCVLVYRDGKNRRAFIHDVKYMTVDDNDLHPLATQCAAVLDFMATHNAHHIAIEVNGLGSALPEVLRDVATRRGASIIVQKIINHTRKELRILDAIEPLLTTGRLFVHERVRATPLLSEMLGWSPMATYGHDDGLDAVAGALRLQPIPVRPMGQFLRPLTAKTEFVV